MKEDEVTFRFMQLYNIDDQKSLLRTIKRITGLNLNAVAQRDSFFNCPQCFDEGVFFEQRKGGNPKESKLIERFAIKVIRCSCSCGDKFK